MSALALVALLVRCLVAVYRRDMGSDIRAVCMSR